MTITLAPEILACCFSSCRYKFEGDNGNKNNPLLYICVILCLWSSRLLSWLNPKKWEKNNPRTIYNIEVSTKSYDDNEIEIDFCLSLLNTSLSKWITLSHCFTKYSSLFVFYVVSSDRRLTDISPYIYNWLVDVVMYSNDGNLL